MLCSGEGRGRLTRSGGGGHAQGLDPWSQTCHQCGMARVTQHPAWDVINPSTMTSHYLGGQMTLDCCRIGLGVCRDQIGTMTHLISIQNL